MNEDKPELKQYYLVHPVEGYTMMLLEGVKQHTPMPFIGRAERNKLNEAAGNTKAQLSGAFLEWFVSNMVPPFEEDVTKSKEYH